jgi:thiol-disulfide isomerase/thioredoxin
MMKNDFIKQKGVRKLKKILSFNLFLIASMLIIISCSEKKTESDNKSLASNNNSQNQTADNESAEKNDAPAEADVTNVFNVKSASFDEAGRIVNFTWDENGKEYSFLEFTKGKPVFMNFWGTWCPPCRAEIPALIEINNELSPKGLVMIGVALERDRENALRQVKEFSKKAGITYKLMVDADSKLVAEYEKAFGAIQGVPTSFLFDKKRKLSDVIVGAQSKEQFMTSINKIL